MLLLIMGFIISALICYASKFSLTECSLCQLQDGTKDEREVDNSDDAASANQKRMNADPLEV